MLGEGVVVCLIFGLEIYGIFIIEIVNIGLEKLGYEIRGEK